MNPFSADIGAKGGLWSDNQGRSDFYGDAGPNASFGKSWGLKAAASVTADFSAW